MAAKEKPEKGGSGTRYLRAEAAMKYSLSLLNASLESTADGILIVDGKGKIAQWNQKFADMWKIPEEVLSGHDDEKAINHILAQLADPKQFEATVRKLYEQPEESSFDQVEFLDGRVFERYSQPQRIEGTIVGRVWSFRDVTERKQANEALARSEERYRSILENMQDSYIEVDLVGNFTFANEAACRNLGFTREQLIGANFSNIASNSDELKAVFKAYNRVYKTGEPHKGFAFKVARKDGTTGYGETSISLLKDAQGRPIGFRSVGRDVTERKQMEEELQRLASVVHYSSELINLSANDGKMIFLNAAGVRMLGIDPDKVEQYNIMQVIPDHLLEKVQSELLPALLKGGSWEGDLQYLNLKTGLLTDVHAMTFAINDPSTGALLYFANVSLDITARKQTEESILRSKLLLQSVIDSTPDWMYVKDTQHRFLLVNKSFAEAQNINPRKMIDRPDTDFFSAELCLGNPDKGISGFHADDDQAFNGRTVHNPRNIVTWADGSLHIYDTYKIPLADQSGKIYAALVYSRDITEQSRAEDEREASFKTLQKTLHDVINTMSKIVEMRDPYTSGHQGRVAELSGAIARQMKLDDSRVEHLMMAASIHDVGKMYVPADILSKPGKLSDIEWAMIKAHVEGSYEILKGLEFSQPIALMALQHHERLDGSGYPNGLKGDEILIEAKILAVADVVEAMSSHRPYRPTLGINKALEEISQNRGVLYDPDIVDICLDLFSKGKFEFKTT
jgi:PAS domain S-box-containing protein